MLNSKNVIYFFLFISVDVIKEKNLQYFLLKGDNFFQQKFHVGPLDGPEQITSLLLFREDIFKESVYL